MQRWCRAGAEGAEDADVQICRSAEVQKCIGADKESCRVAGADMEMLRCR